MYAVRMKPQRQARCPNQPLKHSIDGKFWQIVPRIRIFTEILQARSDRRMLNAPMTETEQLPRKTTFVNRGHAAIRCTNAVNWTRAAEHCRPNCEVTATSKKFYSSGLSTSCRMAGRSDKKKRMAIARDNCGDGQRCRGDKIQRTANSIVTQITGNSCPTAEHSATEIRERR